MTCPRVTQPAGGGGSSRTRSPAPQATFSHPGHHQESVGVWVLCLLNPGPLCLVHCTQTWKPHKEKENAEYPMDGERGPDHSWIHHLNHHARLKNNGPRTPLFSPHPVFYLSFLQNQLLDNVTRDTARPRVNSRVSDSTDSLPFSFGRPFNRGKKKKWLTPNTEDTTLIDEGELYPWEVTLISGSPTWCDGHVVFLSQTWPHPYRGIFLKIWTLHNIAHVTSVRITKAKESLRNCHRSEETWQLNARREKRHERKSWWDPNKACGCVNRTVAAAALLW